MMRRRFAIAVLIVALLTGLLALAITLSYARQKPTADMRYVGSKMTSVDGKYCFERTFWVSNCSDNSILLTLGAVEVNTPQGWSVYTNFPHTFHRLSPYQATRVSVFSPRMDGTWRFRLQASSEMKGLGAYRSYVKRCWGDLRYRIRYGKANRPWPRYGVGTTYDNATELVSPNITE